MYVCRQMYCILVQPKKKNVFPNYKYHCFRNFVYIFFCIKIGIFLKKKKYHLLIPEVNIFCLGQAYTYSDRPNAWKYHRIMTYTYRYICLGHMNQGHCMWCSSAVKPDELQMSRVRDDVHICQRMFNANFYNPAKIDNAQTKCTNKKEPKNHSK